MPVSNFLTIERFRVTLTANGKREIQVENISNKKQQVKTTQSNSYGFIWRETIDFFVTRYRFTFAVYHKVNVTDDKQLKTIH